MRIALACSLVSTAEAGDILRGGSPGTPQPAGERPTVVPSATTPGAQSARDALARTAQALQAVQAMQQAARNAAQTAPNNLGLDPNHAGQTLPNVPNGLAIGGLQVAPGATVNGQLWQGAQLPTQTTSGSQTNVTVTQTQQQALLNWQTFNVGKQTKLTFDQTAGGANATEWIVFNRVDDPSGVPSQILGSLDAIGQIYLINQNGVIFGGTSQVNAHALVASSLAINDNLIERGLLNNPDLQFLFSSRTVPALSGGSMPAFEPPPANTPDGKSGDVTVLPGAQLNSPTTADHVGGRVALIGPNVTNGGTISTSDGQTILAAGEQVAFVAHPSADPSVRGLDVYVGEVEAGKGNATNSGLLDAARGNVTITGAAVNQLGGIDSSTSVALNGSINLLANYNAQRILDPGTRTLSLSPSKSGLVTLGAGSFSRILPDLASTERVVGTQLALRSLVNVQGSTIHLGENSDLLAPSATVRIDAGNWEPASGGFTFVHDRGQVYLDRGAHIDVAGSQDVAASVTDNIVEAQLRGAELANSPLQRSGPLFGQTIRIDIRQTGTYNGQTWIGTPLADVSGYAALVQRTVGQLTTDGGTVAINAGDAVVLQPGSGVNVSGGSVQFAGGLVDTTRVVAGGRIFNIADATPDRLYDGIYNGFTDVHPKVGIAENFTSDVTGGGVYESGYVQGGNGGSLSISAPTMALDGTLLGSTIAGPRQRTVLPVSSSLSLAWRGQTSTGPLFAPVSPTPPNITFATGVTLAPAEAFSLDASGNPAPLRSDRRALVVLSPDLLTAAGFGKFAVENGDGNISVPANVTLSAAAGGAISLAAANLDIEGRVVVPGGTIDLTAFNYSPYALVALRASADARTPAANAGRGVFTLGSTALLSTAGLIVDDRLGSPTRDQTPFVTSGGAVNIASYIADLRAGSRVDVSGGLSISGTGRQTFGRAGSISIRAGQDPNISSLLGGHLSLGATLQGFAGANRGGSLTVTAPLVQIGGTTANPDTLLLAPDFFSTGGFANFTLRGLGEATGRDGEYLPGVYVAPGTVIEPVAQSFIASVDRPASEGVALLSSTWPEGVRAPVSITLAAPGVRDEFNNQLIVRGDVLMSEGSRIKTDARGNVTLSGDTVAVLGSVVAPGGNISVTGGRTFAAVNPPTQPLATVDLGPASFLSTAGTTLFTPNVLGYRLGDVVSGGNINVTGNIVAERGAVLDVSGATDVLDVTRGAAGLAAANDPSDPLYIRTRVDSNGGTIRLNGAQELFSDATLLGGSGGPSAIGGSLFVSSGRFLPPGDNTPTTPLDVTLVVTQSGPTIPMTFYGSGQNAIGHAVLDRNGQPLPGLGYFAADSFNNSGLEAITLAGTVRFSGPVALNAQRSIAVGSAGVIYGDARIDLNAPYVKLGAAFELPFSPQNRPESAFTVGGQPFYAPPTFGSGNLNVAAHLIDVGNLSLQQIGTANLVARDGDVRGDGTFDIAGNLTITAGQVYPTTATSFTLAAFDYQSGGTTRQGSITFNAGDTRQLPLSAGGELDVYASIIRQGGVLRAPLGTINLGSGVIGQPPVDLVSNQRFNATQTLTLTTGSVTSVSAIDPVTGQAVTIPFGTNLNGTSWIDPAGTDITAGGVPSKAINLAGATIDQQVNSTVDLRGGGDLYAYRFVYGTGGSRDILSSTTSFAIILGYTTGYAPIDPNYTNSTLAVGDSVYLNANNGLPAGYYTLLPARYALLPGAFLVTPQTTAGAPTSIQPGGATIVSGYRLNDLNPPDAAPRFTTFEVAPAETVRQRAEYADYSANTFLRDAAIARDLRIPRLPLDSGQLLFAATRSMIINGLVASQPAAGGRGALIDISSPIDIRIAGPNASPVANTLVLDATKLSAFSAESLLIGGYRRETTAGTQVSVTTNNLTVDNAGAPLSAPDLILVANKNLTLAPGAELAASGAIPAGADTLRLGDAAVAGSDDGTLVRVSSDPAAAILRAGVSNSTAPRLVVGDGARITGAGIILDSTSGTLLSSNAVLNGDAIALDSGQISLQLANAGTLQPTNGLVLSGAALDALQTRARAVSLLSYSSIDIYGTGQIGGVDATGRPLVESLALHAGEIRGFNNNGGIVTFTARDVLLDNIANAAVAGRRNAPNGTLAIDAETIRLGSGALAIDQYANVALNASRGVLGQGTGSFTTESALSVATPVITGATGADQSITAGGALTLTRLAGGDALTGGLGARFALQGSSVVANTDIIATSGAIALHATTGDLSVNGRVDTRGSARNIFDLVRYADAGVVDLIADAGNVNLGANSVVTAAAALAGGDAGTLNVSAPRGTFTSNGTLDGSGSATTGSFTLDVGSLPSLATIDAQLNASRFNESRLFRVRGGDVLIDGLAAAHRFEVSADAGSIDVTGTIDASGATGGRIDLIAARSLTLESGSLLTVAAQDFSHAGKGGAISLEAGSQVNGSRDLNAMLNLRAGSRIDLSVASNTSTSAAFGRLTGTLHLRAPQTASNTDVQIAPIDSTINGASAIIVEGYQLFDLTASGGDISSAVRDAVHTNGETFAGPAGPTTPTYVAMRNRLLANNRSLDPVTVIEPGAELINRTGDLALGSSTSNSGSDWDLSDERFGPNSAPGVLTLRAAGNIALFNTISDGFSSTAYNATLLEQNTALPVNAQTWSYRFAAGSDLASADFRAVRRLGTVAANSGSLQLGKDAGLALANPSGPNATTNSAINPSGQPSRYQVIRTGSGDIDIVAARDVQLLNQFATIFTAGTQVTNPTVLPNGTFDLPILNASGGQSTLGAIQQNPPYPAQYTLAGGNVSVFAGNDITHLTRNNAGALIPDSQRELPMNWLYRRGYVDPTTGQFGIARFGDVASTTWWIDFSNFFQGVGALGGGDVALRAGRDVSNVDAVAPTNARMAKEGPSAANLLELGGGDVTVRAGRDIDAGIYYVERGDATLTAGNSIHTNSTRSPSLTTIRVPNEIFPQQTWLPTTLFVGKGSFDVSARGDLLLGPVANPFLLPEGYSNTFWYKSYFSTFAATDSVDVASLTGNVTLRENATLPTQGVGGSIPILQAWLQNVLLLVPNVTNPASFQPWLRLNETSVQPFGTVSALMPASLRATSFARDLNIVGNLTLSPSPTGTIELAAAGAINALQPNGVTTVNGTATTNWGASRINLSDADPGAIPGIASPFAYQVIAGTTTGRANQTTLDFLSFIDQLFAESGSTEGIYGVLQTKQALHAPGLLHLNDPQPVRLFAQTGDISGLTLFAGKPAQVLAGRDVTDVAFYVQNNHGDDVSIIAAGRDIIAYNPTSRLRSNAQSVGNALNIGSGPLAGDVQINGPGTLEVLAGRNFDLGVGPNNPDRTALGVSSIGNARNPSLPFAGADIIAGAGIGGANSLSQSNLDFSRFITEFLDPSSGGATATRYLPELGALIGLDHAGDAEVWARYNDLPEERRRSLALDIFYRVLRNSARDRTDSGSPDFGTYRAGYAAIAALFPGDGWDGDISLTSREIKTANGGNISLVAPGGQLTVGFDISGNQAVDQGILTEAGGNISIFTDQNVIVGTSRIFTLRGGDVIIWSSKGDIAAGASSKTVQSAPPTRVLVDPQSGDVKTDLAGLATGGGIGVLETVVGVPPSDVDLIAPTGTIDAGDAGIRVSGNLNISAVQVLNAGNIQVSGTSVGTPVVAAPNIGGLTLASNAVGATSNAADAASQQSRPQTAQDVLPSIITVEVLGYGGGTTPLDEPTGSDDDEEARRRKRRL